MAGDDLDKMLLAVAGRSVDGENARRRKAAPESSSEDEDGRKKGKMPLKKRFDDNHRDASDEDSLSYGSDLIKDDEDKRKLDAMTEVDREMLLYERGEQRDKYQIRKKGKAEQQRQSTKERASSTHDGPPSSRMRSSSGRDAKSDKANALNELAARRQKAQDTDQQRRRSAAAASAARANRKGRSVSPSSQESEDDEHSSRESNRSEGLPSDDDDDSGGRTPSKDDIRSITIRRSKLFKMYMEPFFEEVIKGCFVRIGIGVSGSGASVYRLCLVKNVDAREPDKLYKFQNKMTHKYLNCSWGDESGAARWQMARASDQPPTDEEIDAWKAEMAKVGLPGPSKEVVKAKKEDLEKLNTYVYSAEAVKQMIQEKKMASGSRISSVALEKEKLAKELSMAEAKGDQELIHRINEKLKELDSKQRIKNEKAERIEMMNRRNRFENFKNASELKPAAKMGEAGYDPFSRRWTRSQNYYKPDAPKTAAEQSEANLLMETAGAPSKLDNALKEARAKPRGEQHYSKMFHLHDFPLDISLASLERYKGSQGAAMAYMERKRAIEERHGVKVESNDGRRHSLTLTVNDYKRRRGLL